MGQGSGLGSMPTGGPDWSNGDEAGTNQVNGCNTHTGLPEAALARSGNPFGSTVEQTPNTAGGGLEGTAEVEPAVAPAAARSESLITRSEARIKLGNAAVQHIFQAIPTAGSRMSAQLVSQYAWSDRTAETRSVHWRAWLQFYEAENRSPLQVTEAHFVAYVGWLAIERTAGRRHVRSSSIPQYLSAVRQMQLLMTGTEVPRFPFIDHLLRAYSRWEEEKFPAPSGRCGIPATLAQSIWALGLAAAAPGTLRDSAMCVFAYFFNGLLRSTVLSLLSTDVTVCASSITARLSVVKGRAASTVTLVSYEKGTSLPSLLDVLARRAELRRPHQRFFALPGESQDWRRGQLTQALNRCLSLLGVCAPSGGQYTSHSLRIGAHTEQVLVGVPLEARARFGLRI